jgi:hypothetical protein
LTVPIINIPEYEHFQPEQHLDGDRFRNLLNTLPLYVLTVILYGCPFLEYSKRNYRGTPSQTVETITVFEKYKYI